MCSYKALTFRPWIFFFSFHGAVFVRSSYVHHPSPNLLEVAMQGMVGKAEEDENALIMKAMKIKTEK